MNHESGPDMFEKLEAAVSAWNVKVANARSDVGNAVAGARETLDRVQQILDERRTLSGSLLVAKTKMEAVDQAPQEREEAVQRVLNTFRELDTQFVNFQLELRTLLAQMERLVQAGTQLSGHLDALQPDRDRDTPPETDAPTEPAENPLEAEAASLREALATTRQRLAEMETAADNPEPSAREQALETETAGLREELAQARACIAELEAAMESAGPEPEASGEDALQTGTSALREELRAVRHELGEARVELEQLHTGPPAIPAEVQEELAHLRAEVAELRAEKDTAPPPAEPAPRQEELAAVDAEGRKRRMGEILVAAGIITERQLGEALQQQQSAWNRHLGAILVDLGYATEEAIAQVLAKQTDCEFVDVRSTVVEPLALRFVSSHLARHHTCIPIALEGNVLTVAMANPLDLIALDDLRLASNRRVKPVVGAASAINAAIHRQYFLR